MNSERVSPHLTAKIVRSYVRHHRLELDQLPNLITSVHRALDQLGQPDQPEEVLTPAVTVRRSVHRDYVTCLDCGYQGKTLRRRISSRHGLNGDEYRRRWGLRSDHPLTAPAYSERRSTLAKELGLGRKAVTTTAPAEIPTAAPDLTEAAATPKARRPRRSPAVSKPEGTAREAVTATPARRRRSRARVTPQAEQRPSPTAES